MWNLTSFCLETVLVSVQDTRTVCAKCTTVSKIVLDTHTKDLPGDVGHVESHFGAFGDSVNVGA